MSAMQRTGRASLTCASLPAVLCACSALLCAACAAPPPPPPPSFAPPPAPVAAMVAPNIATATQSRATTLDGYKRDIALHISRTNAQLLYEGAPPAILRSVVVLSIRVDQLGNPVHVSVVRSNGYTDLEQRAIKSVRDSAPLPTPSRAMSRPGGNEFYETWLFRDDGRFQLRTLAEVQSTELEE